MDSQESTLSDVSAVKEYGLTRSDVYEAMQAGKLRYQEQNMHGNPWYRLIRDEVEKLVLDLHGTRYLQEKKAQTELSQINKELKKIKAQVTVLEKRKADLLEILDRPE
ncbi:MAG: hypothetical protein M0Z41_11580 [Peptococcaceae bacterium]|jgi:hypothetical protein|nr:hypothetical protein [Peptococcaceae bacterium]